METSFVHLRLHTEYSLVDSVIRVKDLVSTSRSLGLPAVATTDHTNLFAMVKLYKSALAAGLKPIIGVDLFLHEDDPQVQPAELALFCMGEVGYRNLTRLVSRSYTEGQQRGAPLVRREWLEGTTEGLIALSGGRAGDIGRELLAGKEDNAMARLTHWRDLFPGRFYLEVQRTGREGEEDYLHAAVELAARTTTPIVATNDVRFLAAEDFDAHEARVCIHDGRTLDDPRRPRRYSRQQYLRSAREMGELFEDLPEALENSVEIARRCNVELTFGENYLPDFPVPEGKTVESFFRERAVQGLEGRLARLFDVSADDFPDRRRPYDERLDNELDVILQMGFPGYFLIVSDFIQWAKDNGVPVGPGRGSGAGSLVAYALGITDLDPLAYDLLFERFLNPERVSMPDFDVDFCMERRDRVIDYVAHRYGRERVSQIITYGSMAAKAVVRDVGRVLGHPYGFVDQIAKLIPFEIGMTLDKALEQEDAFRERYEKEEEVRTLIDLARKLEGLARNAGKHAGGVVIAPSRLTDFTPLYCEPNSTNRVTQLDKDDVEAVGLVKFDFLGLRTLTIIDWALEEINRRRAPAGDPPLDIVGIPLDDPPTFDLLKRTATTAVFQLESRGMKELIKRLQPDCFEDIVALVALFRPGPLQSGMVDDFVNRKHGLAAIEYPHPDLEPILKPTYGVILYQEQVMQIAQVLAGYSLGGADLLRRAMGKKKPAEMARQRDIFMQGATTRGVDEATATYIFDLMEKFAGYGFNKSHSAAYALVSYQTAWLKAHYPAAFMAAVLSSDMDNTDKVVTLIDECRQMGLAVAPPDVNVSGYRFTVGDVGRVLYGLGAIKGVGESAIEGILEARASGGCFRDLFDFCQRIDLKRANRRVLEALIRAGALDGFGQERSVLTASLPTGLQLAEQAGRDQAAGQVDLFGTAVATAAPRADYVAVPPWDTRTRLAGEKETLGLYLTGHPIDDYLAELPGLVGARIADVRPTGRDQKVVVAGLVVALRAMTSKKGGRMAFLTLDDKSGRLELKVFSEAFARHRDLIAKDRLLVAEGSVSVDDFTGGNSMFVERLWDVEQARATFARHLRLTLEARRHRADVVAELAAALEPYRQGECQVRVDYRSGQAQACMTLGPGWRVTPSDELIGRLRELAGSENVSMVY
jgi:DNA polymerase-3 subunit alpha